MPTELRNVMADVTSLDSFLRAMNAEKLRAVINAIGVPSGGTKGVRNYTFLRVVHSCKLVITSICSHSHIKPSKASLRYFSFCGDQCFISYKELAIKATSLRKLTTFTSTLLLISANNKREGVPKRRTF